METIGNIGILILAGIYFIIFNRIFDVFYFGFKGIAGTFIGCVVAAVFTLGVVIEYWQWVFGIGLVVFVLWRLGKNKSEEEVVAADDKE